MSKLTPDLSTIDGKFMTVASAITTILVWIFNVLPPHVEIPGEVGAALTLVIGFLFGWFAPTKE